MVQLNQEEVEVNGPFFLVTPAIILAGIVLFGSSDSALSIADISVPDNEVTSSKREVDASNASATASIRITMTGVLDE